ncbi:MAG: hypothetical protein KDD62_12745, partial [Bdellovibrionales bacterium]|nr:hypothetical protein [Bdellovibrionales bacterium]
TLLIENSKLAESETVRRFTHRICDQYIRKDWPIEPLLATLQNLWHVTEGTVVPPDKYRALVRLHRNLVRADIKFEVLTKNHFQNVGKRPWISEQEKAVARALLDAGVSELHDSKAEKIKGEAFTLAQELEKLGAPQSALIELCSKSQEIVRATLTEDPTFTYQTFHDFCQGLLLIERLRPLKPLVEHIAKTPRYADELTKSGYSFLASIVSITSFSAQNISELLIEPLTEAFDYYKTMDWDFAPFLVFWKEHGALLKNSSFVQNAKSLFPLLIENKIPLHTLSSTMIKNYETFSPIDKARLHKFLIGSGRLLATSDERKASTIISECRKTWSYLESAKAGEHAYRLFDRVSYLENPDRPRLSNFLTRDLPMYALIQKRLSLYYSADKDSTNNTQALQELSKLENSLITNDHPPHAITDVTGEITEKAKQFYLETLSHYRRLYSLFNGFSALIFDGKRLGNEHAPLAQFGNDCALRVDVVNASSIDQFPGRGYLISGLIPSQIFAPDEDSPAHAPSFQRYKTAWPHLANALDHLDKTRYLLTRGAIAVIPP